MPEAAATARPNPVRVTARALGNVALGIAIGLLAYYFITDGMAAVDRTAVRRELEILGPVAQANPKTVPGPTFDWKGWATEDQEFWRNAPPGSGIGRIVIERIKLDAPVVKGTTREDLKGGPGWIEWTAVPGPTGTAGIAGHRTTWGAPFRHIDRLREGDTIVLFTPWRRYEYRVEALRAVRPWQTEVMRSTAEPRLVLSACHPPYSAAYRLTCASRLVSVKRLAGAPGPNK